MNCNRLAAAALPALALLGVLSLPYAVSAPKPALAQPKAAAGLQYQTYVMPGEFSVLIPVNWYVRRSSFTDSTPRESLVLMSQPPKLPGGSEFPPLLVKTDIFIREGPFEEVVSRAMEEDRRSNPTVKRRGKTAVGGQEAFREWGTVFGLEYVVTIIRFTDDETLYLASYYTQQNPSAVPIIQRIHGSIRRL